MGVFYDKNDETNVKNAILIQKKTRFSNNHVEISK